MTAVPTSRTVTTTSPVSWLPVFLLPLLAALATLQGPDWIFMVAVNVSLLAGLKWLSFAESKTALPRCDVPRGRAIGYLLAWPGMDARAFMATPATERPRLSEWLQAAAKLVWGLILIAIASRLIGDYPTAAGWLGMAGLIFSFHCGLFHLQSAYWRHLGTTARPIMNSPLLATSVTDFWSCRWNLAFRDLAHRFVFMPLRKRWGIAGATLAVFVASGAAHELAISVPARGGYGLPTVYFLIQAVGVFCERSRLGRRLGARRGLVGRLFAALVILGPVGLLFHHLFLHRVIVPLLESIAVLPGLVT